MLKKSRTDFFSIMSRYHAPFNAIHDGNQGMQMDRDIIKDIRRSIMLIAVFAAAFVLMYAGVVILTKFLYIYFRGFIPDFNENMLRAVFYGLSAIAIAAAVLISKARYAPENLRPKASDAEALLRHLLITPVITMASAEAVLIFGFFLFFLSAMYADFFVLAAVSLGLIVWSVPSAAFIERILKDSLHK